MTVNGGGGTLFRARRGHDHHRVTYVELFFDLVFVFAVTQLSHRLLDDFSPLGALETALLMLAVWWVWVYTSWVTNWLDPDRTPVRIMMLLLMLGGLGLSMSIPEAFGSRGLVFACSYAGMQVGRTAFMLRTIPADDVPLRRNFVRILAWLALSSVFWIRGGLVEAPTRLPLWGAALAIEYVGPAARFWVPGLGMSDVSDWAIEGGHLAERCGLFIIIALGESVLMTGAAFAKIGWTMTNAAAFGAAFLGTVAMWWIYFDKGADVGAERITQARDPGRLGRLAYTYLHLPIVAGIVLCAVSDEIVLTHPTGPMEAKTILSTVAGPLAYLGGVLLFKHAVRGWYQLSHLAGIGALAALAALAVTELVSPLALSALAGGVLVIVAVWEWISLSARRAE